MSDQRMSAPPNSYARGLSVQGKVIGALLMRELHTRYGRDNVGYLWMFGEPMLLASAVSLIHAAYGGHMGSDMPMIPLAALGYTMFIMFRGMVSRAEGTLESNMPLLYHRTVTVFDMMFARALLEGVSTFVTFLIILVFLIAIGAASLPARPFDLFLGVFMMFWWSWNLSMIVCAITHDNRMVGRLVHPIVYIMMPLSSAFFALSWLPVPFGEWLSWFPMTDINEQLRYGQFESASTDFLNTGYVVACNIVLMYIGLISIKMVRRHVHLR